MLGGEQFAAYDDRITRAVRGRGVAFDVHSALPVKFNAVLAVHLGDIKGQSAVLGVYLAVHPGGENARPVLGKAAVVDIAGGGHGDDSDEEEHGDIAAFARFRESQKHRGDRRGDEQGYEPEKRVCGIDAFDCDDAESDGKRGKTRGTVVEQRRVGDAGHHDVARKPQSVPLEDIAGTHAGGRDQTSDVPLKIGYPVLGDGRRSLDRDHRAVLPFHERGDRPHGTQELGDAVVPSAGAGVAGDDYPAAHLIDFYAAPERAVDADRLHISSLTVTGADSPASGKTTFSISPGATTILLPE